MAIWQTKSITTLLHRGESGNMFPQQVLRLGKYNLLKSRSEIFHTSPHGTLHSIRRIIIWNILQTWDGSPPVLGLKGQNETLRNCWLSQVWYQDNVLQSWPTIFIISLPPESVFAAFYPLFRFYIVTGQQLTAGGRGGVKPIHKLRRT